MMELYRPRRNTIILLINTSITAGVAGYFFKDFQQTGLVYSQVMMAVFGLWAALLVRSLIRRRVLARLSGGRLVVLGLLRDTEIPFESIDRFALNADESMGFVGHRVAGKARVIAVSPRAFGVENLLRLRQALEAARPDLHTISNVDFRKAYET